MPLGNFSDPAYMKFYTEVSEKTARVRQKWNLQHWGKIQDAAILKREDKGITEYDVLKVSMLGGMATVTRDHVSGARNRRQSLQKDGEIIGISSIKSHPITDLGLGDPKEDPKLARPDKDLSPDPVMRPVDPKQKEILYKSEPENGRLAYIESRNRLHPEDKYYFPESSSWLYGWGLKDASQKASGPMYPRNCSFMRGYMSRSGPQPDPDYYKDAGDLKTTIKCGF